MRPRILYVVLVTVCGLSFIVTDGIRAEVIEVVSPSTYASTEAPDGDVRHPNPQDHYQQVFLASDFASLPEGNLTITQFAYRPDGTATTPLDSTYASIEVRLSTTLKAPGNLSMTFAENVGLDETLVLSATDYLVSTQSSGPVGGPKDFDMVYAFDTPFEYDPNQGNLLLDVQFLNHTGWFSADFILTPGADTQMIGNLSMGETANYNVGGAVVQFTAVPEPSTITLFTIAGVISVAVAWRKRKRTLHDNLLAPE